MEEISKSLERYYKNKEVYNERAKKYYNQVWYPKNKERLKKERQEKSKKKNKSTANPLRENINKEKISKGDINIFIKNVK